MFPFFPLPAHFDPLDSQAWQTLARAIQMYLVENQNLEPIVQTLMHEFFWMSFVAAFPAFPLGGDWPEWDSHIPLRGSFISYWAEGLDDSDAMVHQSNFPEVARQYIWRELIEIVGHFLSASIISYSH